MVTGLPRECGREGGEKVEEGPGDDDVVVEGDEEGNHEHANTHALEEGHHFPDGDGAFPPKLAQTQLEEEERQPGHQEHDDVWDEERTCRERKKKSSKL